MTKPKTATDCNLPPHWKVRIIFPSNLVHALSRTEPVILWRCGEVGSQPRGVDMDLITGTEHGDTIGFIDWAAVIAVTWRFAPPEKPKPVARRMNAWPQHGARDPAAKLGSGPRPK